MSATELRSPISVLRKPLRCELSPAEALRCLDHTDRPFALVGAWASGGAIFGCSPCRVARDDEDPFALIGAGPRDSHARGGRAVDAVGGGWVGYLGYPLRALVENGHPSPPSPSAMPAFSLAYYDHVVRCDAGGEWWFESLAPARDSEAIERSYRWWAARLEDPPPTRPADTGGWRLEPTPGGHQAMVSACRERIHSGDIFQANICGELSGRFSGSALELFIRGIESLAPERAAYLEGGWGAIVSLSPELFLERRGRRVRTAPIKGTRPRPSDPRRAEAERLALSRAAKDRAENVMIVDLMRNDLGRVCEPGTIEVSELAETRGHAGVWHLVSEVGGTLRDTVDDEELLHATFPPGSVTGAPKIAAMDVIAELESTGRRVYTGAIGIASPGLGLELSVAIRTFEVQESRIRLGVGGGVVADSDPRAEADELAVKAAPLLSAIGAALPVTSGDIGMPSTPVRRLGPVPIARPDPARGIFETVLVEGGRASLLELHLARLSSSLGTLFGATLPAELAVRIEAAARECDGPARLRADAWPSKEAGILVNVTATSLAAATEVALRSWTLPGGLGAHKFSDRGLLEAMEQREPDELPLLVDADGYLLEASRANVFVLCADGRVRTPPLDGRILPGIARSLVLARGPSVGLDVAAEP